MLLVSASSDGDQEVTEVQFKTPFEALEQHLQGEIWLAPPQFYEFARLATYPSISSLSSFSEKRALNHVTTTWFPIMVSCSDGKYIDKALTKQEGPVISR